MTIALASLAALSWGCGGRSGKPVAGTTSSPSPTPAETSAVKANCTQADLDRPAGPMPTARRVEQPMVLSTAIGKLQLDPPLTDALPAISAETAWQMLITGVTDQGGGRDDLLLGRFSGDAPAEVLPDGTLKPTYEGRLVWALYTHDVATITPVGPPRPSGDPRPTVSPPPCVFMDRLLAIDAETGQNPYTAIFSKAP